MGMSVSEIRTVPVDKITSRAASQRFRKIRALLALIVLIGVSVIGYLVIFSALSLVTAGGPGGLL